MSTSHPVFAILEGIRKRRLELENIPNLYARDCLVVAEAMRLIGEYAVVEGRDWEAILDTLSLTIVSGGAGLLNLARFSSQMTLKSTELTPNPPKR